MSLFRKDAKEFEINGEKIKISPLGIKVIFKLKDLKTSVSEAVAKLMPSGQISDFEKITHSTPKPSDEQPDAIELIDKTTTSAASPASITQSVSLKQQGISAIFDCLLQDDLMGEILINSVDKFKDMTPDQLFNDDDKGLDLPTALEIFGCIVEVNIGGFERLGKYWSPLKNLMGLMQDKG